MWLSIYSTGLPKLDTDYAHIDAVIGYLARASSSDDEKNS